MITKEELKQLSELQKKFEEACENYCKAMAAYDKDYAYLSSFVNNGEHAIDSFGFDDEGQLRHYLLIDPTHLLFSQSELDAYVKERIAERDERRREADEKARARQEERERRIYEELKKKYGNWNK